MNSCYSNYLFYNLTETTRKKDGKVLVHCRAGISRSATICIAYLMVHNSLTLDQAFDFIREKRKIISPNMNFMQQLFEFERMLLVNRVRTFVYPAVHEMASPLSCSQTSERSPAMVANHFNFNVCAVSQIWRWAIWIKSRFTIRHVICRHGCVFYCE